MGRIDVVEAQRVTSRRGRLLALIILAGFSGCQSPEALRGPSAPGSALDGAELALVRGQLDDARRGFAEALELDPENLDALLGSARAHPDRDDVAQALDFYSRYRGAAGEWGAVVHWEYCAVLVLATEGALDRGDAIRALELSGQLISQSCKNPQVSNLTLRSGLALARLERAAGHTARALEVYLSLLPSVTRSRLQNRPPAELDSGASVLAAAPQIIRGDFDPGTQESLRAEAYLGAAELLVESNRRDDALTLLEDALQDLPGDRDLIRLMVATLAERSTTEFEGGSSRRSASGGRDSSE